MAMLDSPYGVIVVMLLCAAYIIAFHDFEQPYDEDDESWPT